MKQILHVVNSFFAIPYFLGSQLMYFKSKGYSEHIICTPSPELKSYAKKNSFKYLETPVARSISPLNDVCTIIRICNYIRNNNIDIIVGHTPKGGLLAMIAGFIMRIPKRIYFRHGLAFETSRGFIRAVLINSDRLTSLLATKIVNVSSSVAQKSLEHKLNPVYKQVLLNKGTCNGIDIKKFYKGAVGREVKAKLCNQLRIAGDDYVIGFTGRLVRDKGIVELVNSFVEFNKSFSNSKLLLVGMMEEKDSLPNNTIDIILKHRDIIYTGYINYDFIVKYYSVMDVFVLPSYREGFPTVVLEASAMEIPVLTTQSTGCIDAIIDGTTGYYIRIDSSSILDKLYYLYRNRDVSQRLGENGRQFVAENFNNKIIWEAIENLYKD